MESLSPIFLVLPLKKDKLCDAEEVSRKFSCLLYT